MLRTRQTFERLGGGQIKIIAAILESAVIERILTCLGLQARAPLRRPGNRAHRPAVDVCRAVQVDGKRGTESDWRDEEGEALHETPHRVDDALALYQRVR